MIKRFKCTKESGETPQVDLARLVKPEMTFMIIDFKVKCADILEEKIHNLSDDVILPHFYCNFVSIFRNYQL